VTISITRRGVIPASEARRESFLKQRKIPDKPELQSRKSLNLGHSISSFRCGPAPGSPAGPHLLSLPSPTCPCRDACAVPEDKDITALLYLCRYGEDKIEGQPWLSPCSVFQGLSGFPKLTIIIGNCRSRYCIICFAPGIRLNVN
jgi:hypothetical protein